MNLKITDPKRPMDGEKYIGLEIELLSPFDREKAKNLLKSDPFRKCIQLKGDGSIVPDVAHAPRVGYNCKQCHHDCHNHDIVGNKVVCHNCNKFICRTKKNETPGVNLEAKNSHELNFLFREKDLLKSMKEINRVLKKLKAHTNKSCGLHVHIDMRSRAAEECFARLIKAQPLLFKLVKKDRRSNDYCKKTPVKTRLLGPSQRHSAINPQAFTEHYTIEVRLHHGTTNVKEIYNWIKLLLSVVEGKKFGTMTTKYIEKQTEVMKTAA